MPHVEAMREIMPPVDYIIGVDLGGTNLRAMLFKVEDNRLIATDKKSQKHEVPDRAARSLVRGIIKETISEVLISDLNEPDVATIIGMSAPGPLDHENKCFLNPPNLPGIKGQSADWLIPFEWPKYLVKDTFAAVVAEHQYGAGQGVNDLVYVTVSTGVGAGIISNGRLHMGASGFAAEFGHIPVISTERKLKCGCGGTNHIEAFASGTGISKILNNIFNELFKTEVGVAPWGQYIQVCRNDTAALKQTLAYKAWRRGSMTPKLLAEAVSQGDVIAKMVWREAGQALGHGLATLITLLNPARIVIGGGVWENSEQLLRHEVEETIKKCVMNDAFVCPIVTAKIGEDVGMWGAAYWALCKHADAENAIRQAGGYIS